MEQYMKHPAIIVALAVLIVFSCFLGWFVLCSHTAQEEEALYLLEAIRQIVRSDFSISDNIPILDGKEVYPVGYYNLPKEQRYIWFTMGDQSQRVMDKINVTGKNIKGTFSGFFVVIDKKKGVVDFGWHKP
jgi:hypothetical protein